MVNRNLYEACIIIRNDPRMSVLKDWLEEEKVKAVEYMIHTNDDRALSVAQGDLRRLTKILEIIEQAPRLLEKAPR